MSKRKGQKPSKMKVDQLQELSHNPFASLSNQIEVTAQKPAETRQPAQVQKEQEHPNSVSIYVRFEKRKNGKLVTCLRQFQGDQMALLKQLRKKLATGGTIEDRVIIIQGNHVTRVIEMLKEQGYRTRGS